MNIIKKFIKDRYWKDLISLQYGRDILVKMTLESVKKTERPLNILDLGLGRGEDISNANSALNKTNNLYGIECYAPYVKEAEEKGIKVTNIDIEREVLPFDDSFFDIIIINQVLEHTKELYFILSEIERTLNKDGICVIGVPNMASWHERLRILFGKQPYCLYAEGPHIRGFTADNFQNFLEMGKHFKVLNFKGSYFYGIIFKKLNVLFSTLFPKLCVTLFFTIQKNENNSSFLENLDAQILETNFYRGQAKESNAE